MKEWFDSLQERERIYIFAGAAALVLILLYAIVWAPISNSTSSSRETVGRMRADVQWMQAAAEQIKKLNPTGATRKAKSNRSLLAVVDQEIQAAGLKNALQRMEPDGTTSVKIWINKGGFDAVISTLGKLEKEQGISVTTASINPADTDGLVDARITLTRGG